jgi:hypothetical protein
LHDDYNGVIVDIRDNNDSPSYWKDQGMSGRISELSNPLNNSQTWGENKPYVMPYASLLARPLRIVENEESGSIID